MKRHQIRKLIPGNISDAQLRAAIAALNLPVDDDLSYGEQETKWIIDSFKKVAAAPAGASDRLNQTRATAQQAAEATKIALVNAHQERLVALNNALDKAEQRRGEVLDRLSDRVAYLQDDGLFLHDLLVLSQQKSKRNQSEQPEKETVTATAFDALIDAFDAVGEWELPQIAPASSPMGCLPIS